MDELQKSLQRAGRSADETRVSQRPQLRLVQDETPKEHTVLDATGNPPWAWFGLVAVAVVSPLFRAVDEALAGFEPTPEVEGR